MLLHVCNIIRIDGVVILVVIDVVAVVAVATVVGAGTATTTLMCAETLGLVLVIQTAATSDITACAVTTIPHVVLLQ